jgi:nucleoside-diphosphate-sugar epimerase
MPRHYAQAGGIVTPLGFAPSLVQELRHSDVPVIVNGTGGWLGRAVLEMLDAALGETMPARVTVFAAQGREVVLRSGRVLIAQDYARLEDAAPPSLILHFAFRTLGFVGEENYIETNRQISRLMQAFIRRNGARGIFIPSSGLAYGPDGAPARDFLRNPYGALKYEDELNFRRLAVEMGFPVAIIRIFNLAGPFINNLNAYALACIIADVMRGGPITIRANHPVFRSFAHIEDVLNIALAILLRGLSLETFDTAGDPVMEIGALAERASLRLAGRALPILRPEWHGQPENRYLGDLAGYRHAAGLTDVKLHDLDQQITDGLPRRTRPHLGSP